MRNTEPIQVDNDARLIPAWSIGLAVVAFAVVEYYFWMVLPATRHHAPPPLGFRI
jgi:hypothetical protein